MDRSRFDRVVAFHNGKGGVKKTSLTANVAGIVAAAAGSHRVLIIDLDKQGNIAQNLGYGDRTDDGKGLLEALNNGTPLPRLTVRENLDVVAGGEWMRRYRTPEGRDPFDLLVAPLDAIVDDYSLVLIDTPPGSEEIIDIVLGVTRHLIIPTEADDSSIRGLASVAEAMVKAQEYNPDLGLLGCILVDLPSNANRMISEAKADLAEVLGGDDLTFERCLRIAKKPAKESRRLGKLVHELAADLRPNWEFLRAGQKVPDQAQSAPGLATDYALITEEMLDRINAVEAEGATGETDGDDPTDTREGTDS